MAATAALALVTAAAPASAVAKETPECQPRAEVRTYVNAVHQRDRLSPKAMARMARLIDCLPQRQESKERAHRRALTRQWTRAHYWQVAFSRLSASDRRWAVSIGSCESGNNPRTNTGNGFYGAMQWVMGTWHAAGGRVHPTQASIEEHWVRAVHWRNRTSTMQWPACSIKLGYA